MAIEELENMKQSYDDLISETLNLKQKLEFDPKTKKNH